MVMYNINQPKMYQLSTACALFIPSAYIYCSSSDSASSFYIFHLSAFNFNKNMSKVMCVCQLINKSNKFSITLLNFRITLVVLLPFFIPFTLLSLKIGRFFTIYDEQRRRHSNCSNNRCSTIVVFIEGGTSNDDSNRSWQHRNKPTMPNCVGNGWIGKNFIRSGIYLHFAWS